MGLANMGLWMVGLPALPQNGVGGSLGEGTWVVGWLPLVGSGEPIRSWARWGEGLQKVGRLALLPIRGGEQGRGQTLGRGFGLIRVVGAHRVCGQLGEGL